MIRAYIAFGSNHHPEDNLRKGISLLIPHFSMLQISAIYENPAVDDEDETIYLNGVIGVDTTLEPQQLKQLLIETEDKCGRARNKSKQVSLDLDLLLYGDLIGGYEYDGQAYHVPHGDVLTCAYVAVPLAHIAPNLRHPETGRTIMTIAAQFIDSKLKRRDDINLLP